ncbi:urea transporter 1 [Pangasianodon hypophthalmus]|uniref:urea transporter 1 n=1 Tax=Pangasianodon hypophthalmus TaxID=310915 RepID=UPI0023076A52|nr:urea transporter 1 [Pangasianodon hypophthalmus]
MFMTIKTCEQPKGLKQHLIQKLLYCTGEMEHFHAYMQDQAFLMQLLEWLLRGVSGVIMVNNPLSGALIVIALSIASPWQVLLGSLGLLSSTVMAILIGQEQAEISRGEHGYNGMLVALLIGVFSNAGDWYWWLLLPACLAGATTTFLHSGMAAVLDRWDVPVSVFPFNTVLLLYLACTGIENPYYPNHPALPQVATLIINSTHLDIPQLVQGAVLGVGQIYACDALGSSLIILAAVLLYSPVQAFHALLGSSLGVLAGLSVAVQQDVLYTGLAGFNGSLGCMAVGGLLFTLSWRTHVFSIICAFLSSYANIALSNLLANVGLPASSWAATLTVSLMLLVSGRSLSTYRIAIGRDSSLGNPLHTPSQCAEANTDSSSV